MFNPIDFNKIMKGLLDQQAEINQKLNSIQAKQQSQEQKITAMDISSEPIKQLDYSTIKAELPKRFNYWTLGPLTIQLTKGEGTPDLPFTSLFFTYLSPYYDLLLDSVLLLHLSGPNAEGGLRWVIDNNPIINTTNLVFQALPLPAKRNRGRIIAPDVQYSPFDFDPIFNRDTRYAFPFPEWQDLLYAPIRVKTGDSVYFDRYNTNAGTNILLSICFKGHYEIAEGK